MDLDIAETWCSLLDAGWSELWVRGPGRTHILAVAIPLFQQPYTCYDVIYTSALPDRSTTSDFISIYSRYYEVYNPQRHHGSEIVANLNGTEMVARGEAQYSFGESLDALLKMSDFKTPPIQINSFSIGLSTALARQDP